MILFFLLRRPPPRPTLFPYTTLFRSPSASAGGSTGEMRLSENAETRNETASVTSVTRSEEHTSELQSHHDLVCRLLLEKKKATAATCTRRHAVVMSASRPSSACHIAG